MSDKVLIVISSGPDTPRRCATPFYYATLAAAMEYEVYMFFAIDGTLLLKKGVAEELYAKPGGKPVSEFMQGAQEAGVHFLACSASTDLHDLATSELIAGVQMAGGARMLEIADEAKTVLSF